MTTVTTEYLDFKAIKERADVPGLLLHYELNDIVNKVGTDEFIGMCPLGRSDHGNDTSFSFNREKKTFQCFSCKKRGSVIDFVKYMAQRNDQKLDLREAATNLDKITKEVIDSKTYTLILTLTIRKKKVYLRINWTRVQ